MRHLVQPVAAAVLLGLLAGPAAAQQRRTAEPVIISAPAGTRIIRPATASATTAATAPAAKTSGQAATASPTSVTAPSGATVISAGSGGSIRNLLLGDVPVPGFGFDHTHHAAVNSSLETLALIDPATQYRLALARQIRAETPRGILFPVFAPVTQVVVMAPPPVIVMQPPAEIPEERFERVRYAEREIAPPPAPPLPVRELDELVFVLRDGTQRLAIAFSVRGERILYISPDGRRRTLALSELDVDATLAANEERGTLLTLPL
jgi:hypothetical protein